MEIRKLIEADIPAVSVLHMHTLTTTIARIGNPYLSDLYHALLSDICLVAVDHKNIIGVITATRSLDQTQKRVTPLLFKPKNMWGLRRIHVMELINRFLFERELRGQFPPPYTTILTFFVDEKFQHHGVGTKLLSTLEKQFANHTKLHVDTETSNRYAQYWYNTHGFRFIKTIMSNNISVKTLTAPAK